MALKEEILSYLRESGGFLSGEELSGRLGRSRTAVWKGVEALRRCGYEIDSATNRGYRLVSCPDLYSPEEIAAGLETEEIGGNIYCYDSVDSTNEEAKRQALRGAPNGSLFIAEQQTGGKGRLGRNWLSPSGTGIWFSVLLRPGALPDGSRLPGEGRLPCGVRLPLQIAATTLLAGEAVCAAICARSRAGSASQAQIKWPNDVLIGTKKVCGILTEMSAEIERVEFVVVGIGINANNADFPEELRQKATSLRMEQGAPVRRISLLQEILRRFELLLKENAASLTPAFLERYKQDCVTLGRRVSFQRGRAAVSGTAADISPEGELVVRMEDGSLETVRSGEVSVQGIYGETV